jgi:hypothetical protein
MSRSQHKAGNLEQPLEPRINNLLKLQALLARNGALARLRVNSNIVLLDLDGSVESMERRQDIQHEAHGLVILS